LETVRKKSATTTPETDETVEECPVIEEPTQPEQIFTVNTSDEIDVLVSKKTLKDAIAEAPEMFSQNWTSQEIEVFREKESLWRAKLKQL
jgi:hypothetical protein